MKLWEVGVFENYNTDDEFGAICATCTTKEKAEKAKVLLIKEDGYPEEAVYINEETDFDTVILNGEKVEI